MLGSQRVFQNTSLPLKNARLTPCVARRLDVRPLLTRPVLVVTAGDEHLVVQEQRASIVDVEAGHVASCRSHWLRGTAASRTRRNRSMLCPGRRKASTAGCTRSSKRLCSRRGCRLGSSSRTYRGCCLRRCCTPATWCPTSGKPRRSDSHRHGRRTRSGCRRRCRYGRGARCTRPTPRSQEPPTTPKLPSFRNRSTLSSARRDTPVAFAGASPSA